MAEEIERNELGQFTKKPDVAYTFDSENAVANQKKGVLAKLDSQRQANDTAMVTAIEHDQGIEELTSEQGAALIVAKQTIKAISPDQPGTTAAARFVFQETGRSQEKQAQTSHTTINMLPDSVRIKVARLLAPVHDQTSEGEVVAGEFREAQEEAGAGRLGEVQGNSDDE